MFLREQTCTICGLNLDKLSEFVNKDKILLIVKQYIELSILQGYTTFQTGMSIGIDILSAEIIIDLRDTYKNLKLVCYQPYETQAVKWSQSWRESYFDILAKSDEVVCLQAHYSSGCIHRMNRIMAENSSQIIAVHDYQSKDHTYNLILCAKQLGLDVKIINPHINRSLLC